MTKTKLEDFSPEIGGLFDDFGGQTVSARFGPNPRPEYTAGSLGIILEIDSGGERPIEQWWSCGDPEKWQIARGGQEIINREKPDMHAFHRSSTAWELVKDMAIAIGEGDIAKGLQFFHKRDHWMTEAEMYTALSFHWKQKVMKTVEGKDRDVLMPTKFLGEVKGEVGSLDEILIELAHGKDEKALKSAAVKVDALKKGGPYLQAVVSGKKLTELKEAGKLFVGEDGKYI
mgnify:CR=1 FL=1